ncbi:MAG: hypothetical protein JWO31_2135 [Phycisphaerales bacterium]|nr:hypothetical protein [Phycisphaerales bacterium]
MPARINDPNRQPAAPTPTRPAARAPARHRGGTRAVVGLVLALVIAAVMVGLLVVRKRAAGEARRERAAVVECLDAVRRVRADLSPVTDKAVVRQHLADAEAAVGRARAARLSDALRRQVDAIEAARRGFADVAAGGEVGSPNPFEALAAVERDLQVGTAGD